MSAGEPIERVADPADGQPHGRLDVMQVDVAQVDVAQVDVVIVSYETPALLEACLRSVREHGGAAVGAVVVVDNSRDREAARIVTAAFPGVRLVQPPSNLGYGAAANVGVDQCAAPFVLLLNADTSLDEHSVRPLIDELVLHPNCAIVGPRLVDHDGHRQPSCARFPTCTRVLVHETGLWRLLSWTSVAAPMRPFYEVAEAADVPWVLGAAVMLRRSTFSQVGGFDPAFFMYFEEVDLSRRLRAIGASTRCQPTAVIGHVGGASTSQRPAAMQRTMFRSLATYQRHHAGPAAVQRLRVVVLVIAAVRVVTDSTRALATPNRTRVGQVARGWALVATDALRAWRS